MIIKRLSASFGRLHNETLTLEPGLNIIEAPNECGKSTWCAFIKTMLYGLRTADRDKAGYLSDKTRYRPWSGAPMAGAMELETGGIAVTIERKTDGKLPMKSTNIYYTGTGQPYGISPDAIGETLLGISEAVFERSAYMSQAGIRVTQNPELEKRITALVTTGDEGASYTEIDERLRAWLRKRRFNKSGTIPALEEKITEYGRTLSRIEAGIDEASAMRLEAERLQKKRAELTKELDALDRYEARQSYRRAADQLAAAKAGYDAVYAELTKHGPAPDDSTVSAIRGEKKTLESLKAMAGGEQKRLDEVRAVYNDLSAQKEASAFGGEDPARLVDKAASLENEIKKLAVASPFTVMMAILLVLAAAAATGFIILEIPVLLPAALIAAAAGVILLIWRGVRLKRYKTELTRLLSRYHAASVGALRGLLDDYAGLAAAERDAEGDVRSAEKSLAAAQSMVDAADQSLRQKLAALSIAPDPNRLEQELDRIDALLKKLSAAKAETQAAESFLKAVRESGKSNPDVDNAPTEPPVRTRQEVTAELHDVTSRFEELTRRYNMAQGEIRALGDPVILGSEKILAEETLTEHRAQFDALSLAIETLKDANLELQSRFSPLLGETAGRIIHRLTSGRYEKLTFDKSLDAFAKTADETVSRNILSLSAGTADQIYLALRLAVCELILPQDEACPLILDDALTNFDDQRAQTALQYLSELSTARQILLFTCHGREGAYLKDCGVNKIKI